jgi:caa(3)-type oxidase subunit IV
MAMPGKPGRKKAPKESAIINQSGCTGCLACVQACPVDCIEEVPGTVWTEFQRLVEVDIERCIGCERCVEDCPWETIDMWPYDKALQVAPKLTVRSIVPGLYAALSTESEPNAPDPGALPMTTVTAAAPASPAVTTAPVGGSGSAAVPAVAARSTADVAATPAAAPAHGHAESHEPAAAGEHAEHTAGRHDIGPYKFVFTALTVMTVLTVGVSYLDFGHLANDAIAVLVAGAKAFLVGLIFMHLKSEHRVILAIALLPLLLVLVLFGLNAWDASQLARGW